MSICQVFQPGCIPYAKAWTLQRTVAQARGRNQCPDSLLLLEHPHTYTLGSGGKLAHLLLDETEQAAQGVTVFHVDRGGDITYHGPGQLVGYPILQLSTISLRTDVVAYVRRLEAILIQALLPFGIIGERLDGYTGVWVRVDDILHKVAAIGVKVTVRGVSYHGFALNVNTDLSYFQGIIPCGIADKPVTSMEQLLGYSLDMVDVADSVLMAFSDEFAYKLQPGDQQFLYSMGNSFAQRSDTIYGEGL